MHGQREERGWVCRASLGVSLGPIPAQGARGRNRKARDKLSLCDLIAPSTDPTIRLEWNGLRSVVHDRSIDRSVQNRTRILHPRLRTLHDSLLIHAGHRDRRDQRRSSATREREKERERGGSRRCSGVYFVVGGSRARGGWSARREGAELQVTSQQ